MTPNKPLSRVAEEEERSSLQSDWNPEKAANPKQYQKCKSSKKLQKYLKKFDFASYRIHPYADVYFLMRYDDEVRPVAFQEYEDSYLETVCELRMFPLIEKQLEGYVKSTYQPEHVEEALAYEKLMQIGNRHYEIICWQSMGFLPQKTEILAVLTETQCVEWLINYKYWHLSN